MRPSGWIDLRGSSLGSGFGVAFLEDVRGRRRLGFLVPASNGGLVVNGVETEAPGSAVDDDVATSA